VIVKKLKSTEPPIYRPEIPEKVSEGVHPDTLTLMKQCWAEEPSERPSFNEIIKILKIINEGKSVLIIRDTVFVRFEVSIPFTLFSVCVVQYNVRGSVKSLLTFGRMLTDFVPMVYMLLKLRRVELN